MSIAPPVIAIVDDDPETLLLLCRLIQSLASHAEIVPLGSGVAALALTAKRPVALVLTDYNMPGMNGAQLTIAIKATSPTTRVAIITAYDTQDVMRQAKAVAADYVLPKPFVVPQLKQMIDEAIPTDDSTHQSP
jgi:two-component system response regulator (stage 0 sporulation protein F)